MVYLKIFYSRCLYQQKEQEGQETGKGGLKIPLSAFLLQKRGKKVGKPGKFQSKSNMLHSLLEIENLQCKYSQISKLPQFCSLKST